MPSDDELSTLNKREKDIIKSFMNNSNLVGFNRAGNESDRIIRDFYEIVFSERKPKQINNDTKKNSSERRGDAS